jgi:nitric oxide reductase NorQ protein
MDSFITNERLNRQSRIHDKHDAALIQEGGYISPVPHLWEDILIGVILKKPVLLKGPSGSGKTKLAQSISHFFKQPMHSVNCSVDLDAESLLGFKTINTTTGQTIIEFIEGPVVQAMKKGHILYIDEINMTNPFTGEVINAHPDFTVIAAINEGYVGTSPMNEALKNRFISFTIPYLSGEQLREIILTLFPKADTTLIDTIMNINEDLKKQVLNGLLSEEAASVRSLLDAMALAEHMPMRRAIRYAIAEKMEDKMERELVMELVETWVK